MSTCTVPECSYISCVSGPSLSAVIFPECSDSPLIGVWRATPGVWCSMFANSVLECRPPSWTVNSSPQSTRREILLTLGITEIYCFSQPPGFFLSIPCVLTPPYISRCGYRVWTWLRWYLHKSSTLTLSSTGSLLLCSNISQSIFTSFSFSFL